MSKRKDPGSRFTVVGTDDRRDVETDDSHGQEKPETVRVKLYVDEGPPELQIHTEAEQDYPYTVFNGPERDGFALRFSDTPEPLPRRPSIRLHEDGPELSVVTPPKGSRWQK